MSTYRAADYIVLRDSPFELFISPHERDRRWGRDFNLPPRAEVDQTTVLAFQMDPSSNADLFVDITINGTNIKRARPRGGVARTVTEAIQANVLQWSNNTILFEMGGSGTVRIEAVVLWFHKELPGP